MRKSVLRLMSTSMLFTLLAACGSAEAGLVANSGDVAQGLEANKFSVCESTPFTPSPAAGFNNWRNAILSNQGVYPITQDIVTLPNNDFNVTSWFYYGALRVAASRENVVLKLDTCGMWNTLGESTTDGGGRAVLRGNKPPSIGRYTLKQEMAADGSAINSTVHVLPAGTHLVVFDIDGTLTTDNGQFVRQQLNSDYVPVAFPDAQKATQAWTDKGYVVVYLTGRPTEAFSDTRTWLSNLGFAKGPTHLTEVPSEMMPSNTGVGEFKKNYLQSLLDKGYVIDYAYGNETTDVYAYQGIGLKNEQIFILGQNAGVDGTQPLPTGYTDNLPFIQAAPQAGQPFSF